MVPQFATAPSYLPGLGCRPHCPPQRRGYLQVRRTMKLNLCSIFCRLDGVRHQKCARGEHHTEREKQDVSEKRVQSRL